MEQYQQQPSQQPTDPGTSLFQLNLDATNSYTLRNAGSWAKVTGVVGICVGVILALLALIGLSRVNESGAYRRRNEGFDSVFDASASAGVGATMLIIVGIIFVIGGIFSFNFGNKISGALRTNDQNSLNKGFAALRNYYALRAIVLILVLLLFLLALAGS